MFQKILDEFNKKEINKTLEINIDTVFCQWTKIGHTPIVHLVDIH